MNSTGWPPNTPYDCAEARRTQVADATFRDKSNLWLSGGKPSAGPAVVMHTRHRHIRAPFRGLPCLAPWARFTSRISHLAARLWLFFYLPVRGSDSALVLTVVEGEGSLLGRPTGTSRLQVGLVAGLSCQLMQAVESTRSSSPIRRAL